MDVGPVHSIRPIPSVRPSPPGSEQNQDLTGVFAAELCEQQRNDSYSSNRKPSSGLEEEEAEEQSDEPENAPSKIAASPHSINFFA